MIKKLIHMLRGAGYNLTSREIAEILWLARHLDVSGAVAASPEKPEKKQTAPEPQAKPPEAPDDTTSEARQPTEKPQPGITPTPAELPTGGKLYFPRQTEGKAGFGTGGLPFRSPAAAALPGTLEMSRALRPLNRRVPSSTRYVLDVEKTVDQIADEDDWVPVLRPAPRRWLDVALVLDGAAAMVLWRQTIQEFSQLLARQGAFRSIQQWVFQAGPQGKLQLHTLPDEPSAARPARDPRELIDPRGERLILVASDCVSPPWYDGQVSRLLAPWAAHGLLAIVQVLPQRLWRRTALGKALPVQFRAIAPGIKNTRLEVMPSWEYAGQPLPAGVPVPVITMEAGALKPWAQTLSAQGGARMPGFILPLPEAPAAEPASQSPKQASSPVELSPEARVERFLATASPLASLLAGYLAAAPLNLPVMRLVQRVMLPQSHPVHLAEVFLSGLIRRETAAPMLPLLHPDEVAYDFLPGVRERLLNETLGSETLEVLSKVSDYVNRRAGQALDFRALLAQPEAGQGAPVAIDDHSRPFATVAVTVLNRLGGQYAQLAKRLTTEPAATRPAPPHGRSTTTVSKQPIPQTRRRISVGIQPSAAAQEQIELDFRVLVLGNFSGHREPNEQHELNNRPVGVIQRKSDLRKVITASKPCLKLSAPNVISRGNDEILELELEFDSIRDFHPDSLVEKIAPLQRFIQLRIKLKELKLRLINDQKLRELMGRIISDLLQNVGLDHELDELIDRMIFKVLRNLEPQPGSRKSGQQGPEVQTVVSDLVQHLAASLDIELDSFVGEILETLLKYARIYNADILLSQSGPVSKTRRNTNILIDTSVARIDSMLSSQLDLILHHPDFQQLEASWRGIYYMVQNTEFIQPVKIELLDARKEEIFEDLEEAWSTNGYVQSSALWQQIYWNVYDRVGAHPYTMMVADYQFDSSPQDIKLLQHLANLGEAVQLPVIGNIGAAFFGEQDMVRVINNRHMDDMLKDAPHYTAWRSLRDTDNARYLGLTLPRFLGRATYGRESDPTKNFNYQETVDFQNPAHFLWVNSSFALAANIVRSHEQWGWGVKFVGVDTGGKVEHLPTLTYEEAGTTKIKIPVEAAIGQAMELQLCESGFIPLAHWDRTDFVCFFEARSIKRPRLDKHDPKASANAQVHSRLQYIILLTRIVHYIKQLYSQLIWSAISADSLHQAISGWLNTITADMPNPQDDVIARHPLRDYRLDVRESADRPEYWEITLELRPHIAIVGFDIKLKQVALFPIKGI